ncbi:hypothetical protein [Anoxybacteroides amylolyticum]|uniref:Uncharacterized protein n=1 Tax=Anoxybacteroides amylolyticum TaxID=294699 RepID=A0A160F2F4_9BACL|nr:hypothetical protein [Anoxybacillus amylolyticus]ANB60409.1 hypothetical protein GFC30_2814 [Anoxybacillus amylolyticus]
MFKKMSFILVSFLLTTVLPWSALANQSHPTTDNLSPDNQVKILLTKQEYEELKMKNKLPNEPIQVVESKDRNLELPEGAFLVKDALYTTDYGKKLIQEFGEDLTKEQQINDNIKIITKVEFKYYKMPTNQGLELSFTDKLKNFIAPKSVCSGVYNCW